MVTSHGTFGVQDILPGLESESSMGECSGERDRLDRIGLILSPTVVVRQCREFHA